MEAAAELAGAAVLDAALVEAADALAALAEAALAEAADELAALAEDDCEPPHPAKPRHAANAAAATRAMILLFILSFTFSYCCLSI